MYTEPIVYFPNDEKIIRIWPTFLKKHCIHTFTPIYYIWPTSAHTSHNKNLWGHKPDITRMEVHNKMRGMEKITRWSENAFGIRKGSIVWGGAGKKKEKDPFSSIAKVHNLWPDYFRQLRKNGRIKKINDRWSTMTFYVTHRGNLVYLICPVVEGTLSRGK